MILAEHRYWLWEQQRECTVEGSMSSAPNTCASHPATSLLRAPQESGYTRSTDRSAHSKKRKQDPRQRPIHDKTEDRAYLLQIQFSDAAIHGVKKAIVGSHAIEKRIHALRLQQL